MSASRIRDSPAARFSADRSARIVVIARVAQLLRQRLAVAATQRGGVMVCGHGSHSGRTGRLAQLPSRGAARGHSDARNDKPKDEVSAKANRRCGRYREKDAPQFDGTAKAFVLMIGHPSLFAPAAE